MQPKSYYQMSNIESCNQINSKGTGKGKASASRTDPLQMMFAENFPQVVLPKEFDFLPFAERRQILREKGVVEDSDVMRNPFSGKLSRTMNIDTGDDLPFSDVLAPGAPLLNDPVKDRSKANRFFFMSGADGAEGGDVD